MANQNGSTWPPDVKLPVMGGGQAEAIKPLEVTVQNDKMQVQLPDGRIYVDGGEKGGSA